MKYNVISRRMFLQGAGATLAIPFLPSVVHGQVAPAKDTFFIFFPFNQGIPRAKFWPINSAVPFTQTETNTKTRLLKDIITAQGKISELVGADWNIYADKINIITHLNMFGSTWDHRPLAPGCASTDYGIANYSLDHVIRESWIKKGYVPKLPFLSVNIGRTTTTGDYQAFSYGTNGGKAYNVIDNIQKLELAVFGSQAPAAGGSQQKLVDAVMGDFQKLMNDRRISSLDKTRLADAMDQWNDIQNNSRTIACTQPASVGTATNFGIQNRQVIDILTASMACGLIRVASHALVLAADTDPGRVAMHDMAHGAGPYMDSFKWKFALMKNYADRLTALKDSNGESLMNSSLLFNSTEYSDFGNHSLLGRTVFTMGTARGAIKTGLHVHAGGAPVQRAHITVMKALGATQAEIEVAGQPGFGEHKLYTESYTERGPGSDVFNVNDSVKFGSDIEKRKILTGLI